MLVSKHAHALSKYQNLCIQSQLTYTFRRPSFRIISYHRPYINEQSVQTFTSAFQLFLPFQKKLSLNTHNRDYFSLNQPLALPKPNKTSPRLGHVSAKNAANKSLSLRTRFLLYIRHKKRQSHCSTYSLSSSLHACVHARDYPRFCYPARSLARADNLSFLCLSGSRAHVCALGDPLCTSGRCSRARAGESLARVAVAPKCYCEAETHTRVYLSLHET